MRARERDRKRGRDDSSITFPARKEWARERLSREMDNLLIEASEWAKRLDLNYLLHTNRKHGLNMQNTSKAVVFYA